MGTHTLEILIKAIDQASSQFKTIGSSLGTLGQDASDAAQSLQPLGVGLAALSATGGALIATAAMTAARVQVLGTVLNTVGEQAGYTTGNLAIFEEGLTEAGITVGAARQGLIQMAQAEIDLSYATDLARLAQNAAVIANLNSSEAYERLITGIQRGEIELLKTMGLTVDFNGAYKKMAAQLGKTTNELTANEKMQARLNETMKAGEAISGVYEDAMGDVGKKLGSVKGDVQDAANALGQAYLPAMEGAVDATRDLLGWFTELDAGTQKMIAGLLAVGTGVAGLGGAVILATPKIIQMGQSVATLSGGVVQVTRAMSLLKAGIPLAEIMSAGSGLAGLAAQAAMVVGPLAAMYAAMVALDSVYQPHIDNIIETTESYHSYAMNMAYAGREADVLTKAEWELARRTADTGLAVSNLADGWSGQYSPALESARAQTDGWATSLELASKPLGELGERVEKATEATDAYKSSIDILTAAIEGPVRKANEEYLGQQGQINERIVEAEIELANLESQQGRTYSSTQELTVAEWKASDATRHLGEMHAVLAENTDPGKQLEIAAAIAEAEIKLDKATLSVQRYTGGVVDNSEAIIELEGDIADWRGELSALDAQHRESVNRILYDIMLARLAVDGWTEAELRLATETAKGMGIIDQATYDATIAMDEALAGFAAGDGIRETRLEIMGISDDIVDAATDVDTATAEMDEDFTRTQTQWRKELELTMELGTQVMDAELQTIVQSVHDVEAKVDGTGTAMSQEFYRSHPGLDATAIKLGGILGTVEGIAGDHQITFTTTYDEVPAAGTPGGPEQYQHGTDYVPRTGWAYLHRGEAVLPAATAAQYRAGNTMNVNLTANYAHQPERSVRDDIRMIQLLEGT